MDNEAGIPMTGMLTTDRSDYTVRRHSHTQNSSCQLTQAKQSSKEKTNGQEREANEEVAALANSWDEWIAGSALPDLVQ